VVSDPQYVDAMLNFLEEEGLGGRLREMERPSMVIEDFAYFLHR